MKLLSALTGTLATLIVATLTSCTYTKSNATSGSMEMLCDNSFENIMEQEINVFEYRCPNAHILCRYVPQAEALDSLLHGTIKTIVIGRDLTDAEKKAVTKAKHRVRSEKIAVDAVALIINKENPVEHLSMKEIGEILAGNITRWEDIQPDALNHKIDVVFDSPGSGLATYMADSLLNGRPFGKNVVAVGSVEKVFQTVKEHVGAIGIIGVSWLTGSLTETPATAQQLSDQLKNDSTATDGFAINERLNNSGVKTIGVMRDNIIARRPYQQDIYDGTYPLTRPIYMITTAAPGSLAGSLYAFVCGVDGQRLIMRTGILPARVSINVVEIVDR